MEKNARIYVAGHRGLVGSALVRRLEAEGYTHIITRTSQELDLRDSLAVAQFFAQEQPEYVFLSAAKVGGIWANETYPAEFIYDNLAIQTNVIHHSYLTGVKKLLFLSSSCVYPRYAPQPMKEEFILTGELEPATEAYAVAKIAGQKMCQAYNRQYGTDFMTVIPPNLYGPNDNFDLKTSHVLPSLLRKFHEAKIHHQPAVVIWGTGTPRREFLHVDDLADACVFLMQHCHARDIQDVVNVGVGSDIPVKNLALLLKEIVNYPGELRFDTSKPDGVPRKLLDTSRITALGWKPRISLYEGIQRTYEWFREREMSAVA
ncbi:MAG: GDP-L-fucose synthase [Calditrichaeota bacterium]|nr:MAG: GDP-L-fucose synthase [Calditrichota bacterium]